MSDNELPGMWENADFLGGELDKKDWEEYRRRMKEAIPHGPDESCTCEGCSFCEGKRLGCTCDIAWDTAAELRQDFGII